MRHLTIASACLGVLLAAGPAVAQFPTSRLYDPATGEEYWIELAGSLWNANTDIIVSSEELGILGSQIDFVEDLALEPANRTGEVRLVLRPGRNASCAAVAIGTAIDSCGRRHVFRSPKGIATKFGGFGWR